MTRSGKLLVAACLALLAALAASAGLALAAFHRAGSLAVEVHEEHGDQVSLRIPAALVSLMPAFLPRQACDEVPQDAWPYIDALQGVAHDLRAWPDATFVEIDGPTESVKIATQRGRLRIRVRSDDGTVEVEIPLQAAASALQRIASVCARTRHHT